MSHPADDDLVGLALGEPTEASVSTHVRSCPDCSDTVASLRRTMTLVSTTPSPVEWEAPEPAVWRRVTAQLDAEDSQERFPEHVPEQAAQAEAEGAADTVRHLGTAPTTSRRSAPVASHRGRVRRLLPAAALAAACLVIGLLAGRAVWSPDDSAGPISQVALSTLDTRQREGEATLVKAPTGLDLRIATDRPLDAGDGYLEVWLINADGKRMVSVGLLQPGQTASFPVSQALLEQGYVVVDISKEHYDDQPAHSGDSLLRGRLPA